MKLMIASTFCFLMTLNGFSQSKIATKDTIVWHTTFKRVPQFPGGDSAWVRFVGECLHYPENAKNKQIEGSVKVRFLVDAGGNVRDAVAISGPEELRAEAERIVLKSPRWVPVQTPEGRILKAYTTQSITFKLPAK